MTPEQFIIWLAGYGEAKPEVLDATIKERLEALVADMVAVKLQDLKKPSQQYDWIVERMKLEQEKLKHQHDLENQRLREQMRNPIWVTPNTGTPLPSGIPYTTCSAE